jgi:hypothetical protein
MMLAGLEKKLRVSGLCLRGLLKVTDEEIKSFQLDVDVGASIALVGNIGASYWPVFVLSPEYRDGQIHPLDRWSRRIGGQLASEVGGKAIYPFEGPPYYPFQQWAKRAESLQQSVMGLMIHPEYGLWHSYRFGLLIPGAGVSPVHELIARQNPCESCVAQPCLNTCPVDAFDTGNYAVDRCATYLKNTPDARCHSDGCLARLSCPVGLNYRYDSAQHRFHLRAFLATR